MPSIHALIKKHKEKHVPPLSRQWMHMGCILLLSLSIGLVTFEFADLPGGLPPHEAQHMRYRFGVFLGVVIGVAGLFVYIIWLAVRNQRFLSAVSKDMMRESIKRIREGGP